MNGPSERTTPPRLAAIDVGTNSIRLIVAQVEEDGMYRVLDEEREMTRLGAGFTKTGRLDDAAMERSLEAIGKMKAIADGVGVAELRAVATSAVREATNGKMFKREAWRRHRVRIDVITAAEEARLAFLSATRRFNLEGRSVAVADIGGGSLEIVLSAGEIIDQVYSLELGAIRLTERFVRSDPLRKRDWKALRGAIDSALAAAIGKPPFEVDVMVGSGGTFSALGGMARYEREGREGNPHGYTMTRAEATKLLARLKEIPLAGRRRLPGLPPQRADIMLAGVAVVARLAKYLGCRQIMVNDGGVRDGLLLSMIEELDGVDAAAAAPPQGRLDAVRRFAQQCRSNERHCEHVAYLAGRIFDSIQQQHPLPAAGRELLVAAALLHEIGFLINHAGHHKHAYHLIMHSDLAGYSSHEIELVANIVRYHRRALPKKKHANFALLDRHDRKLVGKLAGVLRLAAALDRTHTQLVRDLRVSMRRNGVRISLVADEEPQVELWDARRKDVLFETAFRTTLDLVWTRRSAAKRGKLLVVSGGRRATGE